MSLEIFDTFNFMIVLHTKYNILMYQFHMLDLASVFGDFLFSIIAFFLVPFNFNVSNLSNLLIISHKFKGKFLHDLFEMLLNKFYTN